MTFGEACGIASLAIIAYGGLVAFVVYRLKRRE